MPITITINGQDTAQPDGATVASLLASLDREPRLVAVEVNRDLVPRRLHEQTPLADGDAVEIVSLVGGG
jgi:thiamine biosynthesis protein ThiS